MDKSTDISTINHNDIELQVQNNEIINMSSVNKSNDYSKFNEKSENDKFFNNNPD
jgi:hypothetical protein